MSNHCTKPDRHVAKLVCGYPMPCPHHTFVIESDNVDDAIAKLATAIANVRYLSGRVTMATTYGIIAERAEDAPPPVAKGRRRTVVARGELKPTETTWKIRVTTRAWWSRDREGIGGLESTQNFTTDLPLHASLTEIRNAAEEQQLEARAWLEERYATRSPSANERSALDDFRELGAPIDAAVATIAAHAEMPKFKKDDT